ncbi:hypothetical protein A33Q_2583 [Indibacter alkaliphilus LW1]|uniref:Uncharacterized protein n=1 Tax=Indibacter alkaliphilus (strain CCUG 57479 / KCTC 22604 / LW1) TaxID=1189612 RepID=S2DG03_INDAL|nr:hypothetical protein A33Q_2583 [Indibacter alkaliphilus LW1]
MFVKPNILGLVFENSIFLRNKGNLQWISSFINIRVQATIL